MTLVSILVGLLLGYLAYLITAALGARHPIPLIIGVIVGLLVAFGSVGIELGL